MDMEITMGEDVASEESLGADVEARVGAIVYQRMGAAAAKTHSARAAFVAHPRTASFQKMKTRLDPKTMR